MNKINKKILLLVVEDEKILADTLKERLEQEGFEVLNAYDGSEGLKIALDNHPDLILLDLLIPKIDGITVLNKLHQDPWGAKAKVIILTNVSDPANIIMKTGLGGLSEDYEYLIKTNWSLDAVVYKIRKALKLLD